MKLAIPLLLAKFASANLAVKSSDVKVGLSPSKNNLFYFIQLNPLKMMKNVFYFILKALFVFKIFKFQS